MSSSTHLAPNSGFPDPEFAKRLSRSIEDTYGVDGTANLPTVENSEGGKQSSTVGRFDLIPGEALVSLAKVYGEGAKKYEVDNWHKIDFRDHINHALEHLAFHEMGDTSEPHLDHALCRLSMAVWARANRKNSIESGPIQLHRTDYANSVRNKDIE